MRGLMMLALGLTVAGAPLAPAQPAQQRPPDPLPPGAIVELRFAKPRDVPLLRGNGDTVIARDLAVLALLAVACLIRDSWPVR
jgi:hypothetical protein